MVKEIQVTKEHIMEGEPGDASHCAIACAIADEYGVRNSMIGVESHDSIFVDYGNCWTEILVEPEDVNIVDEFIESFDYIDNLGEDECPIEYKNNLKEFKFRYTEIGH
tara:strand:+ start:277 stop:600 length:324 start_codon:yes stop_codon:yes gene_type:complete